MCKTDGEVRRAACRMIGARFAAWRAATAMLIGRGDGIVWGPCTPSPIKCATKSLRSLVTPISTTAERSFSGSAAQGGGREPNKTAGGGGKDGSEDERHVRPKGRIAGQMASVGRGV